MAARYLRSNDSLRGAINGAGGERGGMQCIALSYGIMGAVKWQIAVRLAAY